LFILVVDDDYTVVVYRPNDVVVVSVVMVLSARYSLYWSRRQSKRLMTSLSTSVTVLSLLLSSYALFRWLITN